MAVHRYTTGSQFTGETELGKMTGYGEYVFSTGTVYKGHFKDGLFHGEGKLIFPNGGTFTAEWSNGEAISTDKTGNGGLYTFQDGLQHKEPNWSYCYHKDRRFYTEVCKGIQPAGCTQLTNSGVDRLIPSGWFDTGDGLYNPENHVVYKYSTGEFLRNADLNEHEWIVTTCRKGVEPQDQLGPNGLYQ